MHTVRTLLAGAATVALTVSCGGGGGNGNAPPPTTDPSGTSTTSRLFADPVAANLSIGDVETIIAQAVAEAGARGTPATIAVVDRVGNVLAVYEMNGALTNTVVDENPSGDPTLNTGVQGVPVPSTLAAISKAITGAYLSSSGNAFTTRTASMIIQEHFPPAPGLTTGLESGPLFGVQFSSLPCSDLVTRRDGGGTRLLGVGDMVGPNRAPLGLSADPGGIPLYKNGVVVGGIGISADDTYTFDSDVTDFDVSDEEAIAVAGSSGFAAPESVRANRISVDGTSLRFTDMTVDDLVTTPATAPGFGTLTAADGALTPVRGYTANPASIVPGATYGTETSGIRPSSAFNTPDAYVLSDGFGANRFAPRAGTDGAVVPALTQAEVTTLLEEAFNILSRARAQIRQPLNSRAQVSVSVVDTNGQILGVVRSPDAPIFGIDVSLQKARTAAFFSGPDAGAELLASSSPAINAVTPRVRQFLNDANALTGTHAFADRSGGNLARPFFPDGEAGNGPGPLSVPIEQFNPFGNGFQVDLVVGNIAGHIAFVNGMPTTAPPPDTPPRCGALPTIPGVSNPDGSPANRMQNGAQIFPGSVPIYRGDTLIGGIGVSGDGIDQDDMISFLGLHNAGLKTGTINNAPPEIRADRIVVQLAGDREVRLRYINCPFAPFVDDPSETNVCQGK